jgi:hypothetical protein
VDRTPRRIAVVVALGLTATAISIPVAQAGIRPDDRAVRDVNVVVVENSSATRPDDRAVRDVKVVAVKGTTDLNASATRPDDRAVRGVIALDGSDDRAVRGASVVASAPGVVPVADQGFAWMEAALGASSMLVLLCLLAGAGLLIARQRKPALQ